MPLGIARRQIGGTRIGAVSIAQAAYSDEQGVSYVFPVGSWTFTPPKAGYWKIVLRGPGAAGSGSNGGGSGAYLERTVHLTPQHTVLLTVSAPGSATVATLPGGGLISAGAASGRTGGAAIGGDLQYNGSMGGNSIAGGAAGLGPGGGAGTSTEGGAGSPGTLQYLGTSGANLNQSGRTPGAGGSHLVSTGAGTPGGDGQAILTFMRD